MSRIDELLTQFSQVAANPRAQLNTYKEQGKKVIGCFPYYVPEEIVTAGGMVPFGVWGAMGAVSAAKEYFAPFYCTIAQMNLEMGLTGKLDNLDGVIVPSMCDTLRPLTQNFRVAVPQIPFIFLAHGQNRRLQGGLNYHNEIFTEVKEKLEKISGSKITDADLKKAFEIHNKNRAARREFVKLAAEHADVVTARKRSGVLKSAHFMLKDEHTALLEELNAELKKLEVKKWKGVKVVTSGIINDNPNLLAIFEENNIAIVGDDIAHESRGFRVDVPDMDDPMDALAHWFAAQDYDPLLYDPELNKRPEYIVNLVKESGAQGVVILQMQFCDPEELEYPSLKKGLDEAGIPSIMIGVDQQMRDFGQARTSLQAFTDLLNLRG